MNQKNKASRAAWPKKLTDRSRVRTVRSSGITANETTNLVFGVRIADEVRELEPGLVGGTITVSAFTPSGRDAECEGIFIVEIEKCKRCISIAVVFPVGRAEPKARKMLNLDDWPSRGYLPTRDDIRAASWEEAWLIVCEIGEVMEAKKIYIGYGGFEF